MVTVLSCVLNFTKPQETYFTKRQKNQHSKSMTSKSGEIFVDKSRVLGTVKRRGLLSELESVNSILLIMTGV